MKQSDSIPDPQVPDEDRIELPFEHHRGDWLEWVYDHRVAILVTLGAYLLLAAGIVTARITLEPARERSALYMDMQQLEQLIEEKERLEAEVRQMQALQEMEREYYEEIRNRVSSEEGDLNSGLRDAQGTQASDIYNEARALEASMQASREAYEQGVRDAARILENRSSSAQGGENNTSQKVSGPVSISYSLPGRYAEELYRPTYQCRGGGTITVNIVVNRNGQVTSATVASGSSSDACLQEFAVRAAQASRFNFDGTADNRQSGTITYVFVPQ